MTEKRFTIDSDGKYFDKLTQKYVTIDYLFDLVNELNDEVNLQQTIIKMKREQLNSLKAENEQLKQTIDRLTLDNTKQKKVLNATKKENEQLKQQLQDCKDKYNHLITYGVTR